MAKTKLPAADCSNCSSVFEYEERDLFSGEIFCPVCMSRVQKKHRHTTLRKAQTAAPEATTYAE